MRGAHPKRHVAGTGKCDRSRRRGALDFLDARLLHYGWPRSQGYIRATGRVR